MMIRGGNKVDNQIEIAVSSYSFSPMIRRGELTQLACIGKAKELGFSAIEFTKVLPHDHSTEEEYAVKLREECNRYGMTVSNFTFGADFLNGSEGDTQKEIERVKRMVDIAEILGTKSVRHDITSGYPSEAGKYRSFDSLLPILANACREVTEYAQKKGIRTMGENHGTFCQESMRVEKLVNEVNHENFGLLVDIGNFLCADEDPQIAVSRVAPYAFYVHAKDFLFKSASEPHPGEGFSFATRAGNYLRGTIVGHGIVPVRACMKTLLLSGYRGYVAIEFEGIEDNMFALKTSLDNLKKYIASLM